MINANLLLYINLSGEVFYIIGHRMKSQRVAEDLQKRVFNDLSIAICHPTVVQNIIKGSLQILELSLADVRILMDRVVHSSIMTVNAYSMEKLFELTLIATRFQYSVCQYPTDILLIAINHLETIRKNITDSVGIQLTENLHKMIVDRMKNLNAFTMQSYRYAILTYLSDVRLKMTNLIKLGMQKPTGEFVKNLPDRVTRPELRKSGTIEIDEAFRKNSLDEVSESDSESNGELKEDESSVGEINEELENVPINFRNTDYEEEDDFPPDLGCHFDQINLNIGKPSGFTEIEEEDDEILEVEWAEEQLEQESTKPMIGSYIIRFHPSRSVSIEDSLETLPFECSLDLMGYRNIALGQSIYDIPGNSDEDAPKNLFPSQTSHQITSSQTFNKKLSEKLNVADNLSKIPEATIVDPKGMQGLDLCSIMLGCSPESSHSMTTIKSSSSFRLKEFELKDDMGHTNNQTKQNKSPISGINIVRFDAALDRSNNKSALEKISKEFDLESPEECDSKNDIFLCITDD